MHTYPQTPRWAYVGATVRGRHIWRYDDAEGRAVFRMTFSKNEPLNQSGYRRLLTLLRYCDDAMAETGG